MKKIITFSLFLFVLQSLHAQDFTDSNLPILVISTEDGNEILDEPKITAHLGIIWNGEGERNYLTDPFNDYDGQIGIEIRGQSSQWFPKKSYGFETRLADGSNNNVNLLEMPKENDWVLHGPFSDKSLIRNALAYTLAGKVMPYAPRVRMVEVLLNEEYIGVYLLTEKIKKDDSRVDIAKLDFDDNAGDSLTGGYILKMDKYTEGDIGFKSNYSPIAGQEQETWFFLHYPKAENISQAQFDYIRQHTLDFEEMLWSSNFADPTEGYAQWLDVQQFIDYLFVNELTRNVDAYRLSTFFYKDKDSKDGRFKMGPVWDYNLSLGNADYCEGWNTEGWGFDFNEYCPGDAWVIHFWWHRLMQDEAFLMAMKNRWIELRANEWSDENIFGCLDDLSMQVEEGAARNFQKYPILNDYVWPNSFVGGNFDAEVNFVENWLVNRLAWLDGATEQLVNFYNPNIPINPQIYPNPSKSEVNLSYYVSKNTRVEIELYNAQGQHLETQSFFAPFSGENTHTWSLPAANGIYFYSIKLNGEELQIGKLLKQE